MLSFVQGLNLLTWLKVRSAQYTEMASNREKLLRGIVHNDWKQVQHCGVDSDRRCGTKGVAGAWLHTPARRSV